MNRSSRVPMEERDVRTDDGTSGRIHALRPEQSDVVWMQDVI